MDAIRLHAYSLIWWLVLPLVLLRLWWRGRREPGYRQHIAERLGIYALSPASPLIWVHAVSVGETRAAEPLIRRLLSDYPTHSVLLTHMTATGRATGQQLFDGESRVIQAYLPYDTRWMTQRFCAHFRPQLCVLMETEVWPCLIDACHRAAIPITLVNARLSERSLRRGQYFAGLLGAAARKIDRAGAQTEADAIRLRAMGAQQVTVTGSLKFDIDPPADRQAQGRDWRARWGNRPVLLCASTREGEERLLLDAMVTASLPEDFLVLIVPRHPQRFDEVANLIEARGFRWMRRSAWRSGSLPSAVNVVLGDSMGEMFAYYAAADIAFIGGSLLPLGGQNLVEALSCGKPAIVGPHTFNFAQITEDAIAFGVAVRIRDADDLFTQLPEWLEDTSGLQDTAARAAQFTQLHRGATEKTLRLLSEVMR
ncbi:MAG: lipid IV(A) 3-deoxy-D-manno-octulosonic acid transferase [Oxalobacteraceae bacterium]|nr:lipid IV(A) 3-deoxy-D-manno-octulosonic acid transferase [Oxalobacteraceae bacterium]